jgi:hypothetical protein
MNRPIVKYKRLPKLVKPRGQGFEYHLVKRKGNIAWYEARYLNGSELKGWVVAKIRTRGEEKFPDGYTLPPREIFPKESRFGKDGWFYMPKSRSIAEEHFVSLTKKGAK